MKTRLSLIAVFLFAAILLFASTAPAAIPHLMNFQGKATDKTGAPLSGTYNLTFRIYDAETGGTAKWSETQTGVQITNGIFQVQLGSVTALTLSFDMPYWISLEINSDGEMSPRTRLASVPYAYKAESLTEAPVIPFYKKGFDVEKVDSNSIKISAGVMDLAGKMLASTAYSDPLRLEYLDELKNRDWIHGSNAYNSIAYVYAFNNNGQIAFKFSDEAPELSDQYGNIAKKPLLYKKYPNTIDGIFYRCIGEVYVDNVGKIVKAKSIVEDIIADGSITLAKFAPDVFYTIGNTPIISSNTERACDEDNWKKLKEITVVGYLNNTTVRVMWYSDYGNVSIGLQDCVRLYINGQWTGVSYPCNRTGTTFTVDVPLSKGDTIELWAKKVSDCGARVYAFKILADTAGAAGLVSNITGTFRITQE